MDRRDGEEIDVEIESWNDEASAERGGSRPIDPRETAADADLADELGRISIRSTPEGYVEGRVTGLETVDETTVRLTVRLPHDRTVTFALEKPVPWSEEFLLARIVDHLGYDAASIDHVVGETVYVTRADLEEEPDRGWYGVRESVRAIAELLEQGLGERETGPTWRLVDPRELPGPEPESRSDETIATAAVLLGAVAAAVGAVVGATGGFAVPLAAVGYALPGLALVLVGLALLRERIDRRE